MLVRFVVVLLLGGVLLLRSARAQDVEPSAWDPGMHRDTVNLNQPQPYDLRPFILRGSETIYRNGAVVDTTHYRLDYRHGHLWMTPEPDGVVDTVVAIYRTLPFAFQDVYRRRSIMAASTDDTTGAAAVVREEPDATARRFDPFAGSTLQRSGSITRGVLAGNNRDVTIESGLRMQLSGEITEGVEVQAVLTDENTPIQPEGTTQRINDFDRVFIQVQSQQGTAQLGDVDLTFDGGTFAPFARKLQGATVVGRVPGGGGPAFGGGQVQVAGAVARGEYRTQEIAPIDGVQGPYRLEGKDGAQFIIVVAGSETVYLDGVRLTRGESNDYTIDYATGEITFMPNRLITEDRRITVEFQYTTNQFTRTLLATEGVAQLWQQPDGLARAHIAATFIREADSREFSDAFNLSREDSLTLVNAGDGRAESSGAEPVRFDPEAPYVQYRRAPLNPPEGDVDSIFVAVQEAPPDSVTVYRVRFTRVGNGQGDYERVGRLVNGILYEYRGPNRGSYDPVRILPRPQQQQVFDLRGGLEPIQGLELFGEWARSLNDQNRLSSIGSEDDLGNAYLAGLRLKPLPLAVGDTDLGKFSAEVRRRYTAATFTSFDRIRPVEFARQWNLDVQGTGITQPADEQIDEAHLQWVLGEQASVRGAWGHITRGALFEGTRRALALQAGPAEAIQSLWPQVDYEVEYITSRDTLQAEAGGWLRQRGIVRKPLLEGRLVPRVETEQERRRQRALGTDSLTDRSFAFVEVRPGLYYQTEPLEIGGEVEWRTEERGAEGILREAATAWTAQTQVRYRPGARFDTEASIGYRLRHFTDYFRIQRRREDTESLLLRWKGRFLPLQRAVEVDWFYEAQTERTPRLQEIYVRTGPELGQYVWQDANGDGAIQIGEFVPETTPNEGVYVKTFIPSDTLESVASVQARLRLGLDPARLWQEDDVRWKRWLRQVQTRTTLEVLEKSRDADLLQIYVLNLRRFRDPLNTLNGRLRIGQDVTLFRTEPRYGLELSFNQLHGLSDLAAGEEARFQNLWRAEGRYRLAQAWNVKMATRWEINRSTSDSLSARNYDIASVGLEPEVSFQPGSAWQLTAGAALAHKVDDRAGHSARVVRVPVQVRYNRVQRLQLQTRFELSQIDLEGEAVGLAQYELTEGRGPGRSYLWNVSAQYRLNAYLRASLSYDGRAPADAPVIHTARMELSATF